MCGGGVNKAGGLSEVGPDAVMQGSAATFSLQRG